mmetsp:Transcript_48951/g.147460  ORF Transcript_48951/g.147460 Transcript_48951/m.147460 type:complete len:383 (+) Transcript_48951:590-1738(+)
MLLVSSTSVVSSARVHVRGSIGSRGNGDGPIGVIGDGWARRLPTSLLFFLTRGLALRLLGLLDKLPFPALGLSLNLDVALFPRGDRPVPRDGECEVPLPLHRPRHELHPVLVLHHLLVLGQLQHLHGLQFDLRRGEVLVPLLGVGAERRRRDRRGRPRNLDQGGEHAPHRPRGADDLVAVNEARVRRGRRRDDVIPHLGVPAGRHEVPPHGPPVRDARVAVVHGGVGAARTSENLDRGDVLGDVLVVHPGAHPRDRVVDEDARSGPILVLEGIGEGEVILSDFPEALREGLEDRGQGRLRVLGDGLLLLGAFLAVVVSAAKRARRCDGLVARKEEALVAARRVGEFRRNDGLVLGDAALAQSNHLVVGHGRLVLLGRQSLHE